MAALNGEYEASYDGKAPKACVEELHFGLWGEDPAARRRSPDLAPEVCRHESRKIGVLHKSIDYRVFPL